MNENPGGTRIERHAPPTAPWRTRRATAADLGYVWKSLGAQLARPDAQRWRLRAGQVLSPELIQRRELTLARYLVAEAFCTVAFSPDYPEMVNAWIVFDPWTSTVHYVYTGRNFRRLGIARALLEETVNGDRRWLNIFSSHQSKPGEALLKAVFADPHRKVRFDPYRAFFARDFFLRPHDRTEAGADQRSTHSPERPASAGLEQVCTEEGAEHAR